MAKRLQRRRHPEARLRWLKVLFAGAEGPSGAGLRQFGFGASMGRGVGAPLLNMALIGWIQGAAASGMRRYKS